MNASTPFPTETPAASGDYFTRIPLWNATGQPKRFEVMADELSGRIPVNRTN